MTRGVAVCSGRVTNLLPGSVGQVLLAFLLPLIVPAPPALAVGQVGDPAADFSLQDTAGVPHTLSDYRDQVVVLFMMGYA
jgi:hypothetical protein